jgi:hypothetical protein
MNLPRLTLLLAIAFACTSAHAQVGIYGKFDSVRFSDSGSSAASTVWFYGPGAGIYYSFLHLGPASIGADLRGNWLTSSQQNQQQTEKYRSALFGLRLAVKPLFLPLRPYIQGSVGVGGPTHNNLTNTGTIYSNKFQYQILGGLDIAIFPHLDWRVAEIGYGRMSGISNAAPAPTGSIFTAGAGLVLRFP